MDPSFRERLGQQLASCAVAFVFASVLFVSLRLALLPRPKVETASPCYPLHLPRFLLVFRLGERVLVRFRYSTTAQKEYAMLRL